MHLVHKWGTWSLPFRASSTCYGPFHEVSTITLDAQRRVCETCGKVQQHEVGYAQVP